MLNVVAIHKSPQVANVVVYALYAFQSGRKFSEGTTSLDGESKRPSLRASVCCTIIDSADQYSGDVCYNPHACAASRYAAEEPEMAKRTAINVRFSLGVFFLFCYLAGTTFGQAAYSKQATISESAGKIQLAANDSRPLTQALDALQQKYGWRVNYEDPQYTSKLDVIEAKGLQDKSSYPNGPHRVPSGAAFSADLGPVPPANASLDEKKTLQLLIDSYNRSSNPGRFELREDPTEQVFNVVGTSAHDNQGRISPQQVVLDLPISIDAQDRSFSDTIDLICQKVSEKSHITLDFGVHPLGLDQVHVTAGGKDLAARSILLRALASTGRKLCWRLLFDPDSGKYFLNVQLVKRP
jgi:hypothetical protein